MVMQIRTNSDFGTKLCNFAQLSQQISANPGHQMGVDPGFRLCHISNVNADEKFTFSFWWVYKGGGAGDKIWTQTQSL